MTKSLSCLRRALCWAWLAALLGGTGTAWSGEVVIAVISQADDVAYDEKRLEKRYPGQPSGRPLAAMQVAVEEASFALQSSGQRLKLLPVNLAAPDKARELLDGLAKKNIRYAVLDLPLPSMLAVVQASQARPFLLFNPRLPDDSLRAAQCAANLLHTLPSQQMQADAVAQYLAVRRWKEVLMLTGPLSEDALQQVAFSRAVKRFGLKIVAQKPFKLSTDPRERDLGNPYLLTATKDYDAVVVNDSEGEFARALPYATKLPRPVVGANGLTAEAWHWAADRNGAPQLSRRFSKAAKRPMTSHDWAAWMAVKAIAEIALRQPQANPAAQLSALRNGTVLLDGFKGVRLSFRAWDGQLRQPLFLAHGNGAVGVAPAEGFLHAKNTLDSLGVDEKESQCKTTVQGGAR